MKKIIVFLAMLLFSVDSHAIYDDEIKDEIRKLNADESAWSAKIMKQICVPQTLPIKLQTHHQAHQLLMVVEFRLSQ